ncbi:MAG: helix-turn-helix domain-containing protein [Actinomycetota bacterium]
MEKTEKRGLGRAIRVIRTELGLSRRALEERTRLSYPYLSEIEAGKKTPSPVAMLAISNALEVPEAELLERARDIEQGQGGWSSVKRRHFHTEDAMEAASLAKPSLDMARYSAPPAEGSEPAREETIAELLALVSTLPPEDQRRLLDLARRLQR